MAATITGGGALAFRGRSAARTRTDVVNSAVVVIDTNMNFFILLLPRFRIGPQNFKSMTYILYLNACARKLLAVLRRRNKRTVTTQIHDTAATYQILRKLGDNLRVFGYLQNFGGSAVLQVDAFGCSMQAAGLPESRRGGQTGAVSEYNK